MTKKIYHFVSHYPCSLICITLIWVLSLTPLFPETPLDDVAFIDKWTHLVMYGGTCSVMWWEHVRHTHLSGRRQTIHFSLLTILFLVALGGLMELLQAHCTTTRSGEWLDFWADSLGVVSGTLVGLLINTLQSKKIKISDNECIQN